MKAKITYYSTLIVFFILLSYNSSGQFYNGSYQEFGKNRVQETTFFWQYYDFERFKVYFYGDGATNAEYAAKSIHKNLQELELFFETQVDSKFDVTRCLFMFNLTLMVFTQTVPYIDSLYCD